MTTSLIDERIDLPIDERLARGREWVGGPGSAAGDWPAVARALDAHPGTWQEDPSESWGVALELGHRGVRGLRDLGVHVAHVRLISGSVAAGDDVAGILGDGAVLGTDPVVEGVTWLVEPRPADSIVALSPVDGGPARIVGYDPVRAAPVAPYRTVWDAAVSVGALLRLREVAVDEVARAGGPGVDALTLERLGRVDSVAWAGATALDALVGDVAGPLGGGGPMSEDVERRIASTAAAIAGLASWTHHDLIPGAGEPDPYLEALAYVAGSARAAAPSYLQRDVGRHLLTGGRVFQEDRAPIARTGDGRNS